MKVLVEQKYIGFLSSSLPKFKRIHDGLYEFQHSCERSSSTKTRGRISRYPGQYQVYCHNCGYSHTFSYFLRELNPTMYAQYRLEIFRGSSGAAVETPLFVADPPAHGNTQIQFTSLLQLPSDNLSVSYAKRRMIPKKYWGRIGHVDNFCEFARKVDPNFNVPATPRIIFPYYDAGGNVFAISGRSLTPGEEPRYSNLTVDKSKEKIYGLWKVDLHREIIAVEGQIDSLFLDNAVGAAGMSYRKKFFKDNKDKLVICPDNDFVSNKQVRASLLKSIKEGAGVCLLYPKYAGFKDINDIIMSGVSSDELMCFISKNTKRGLAAELELTYATK